MKVEKKFMTGNDCYVVGAKITPKGIMIHSTATPGVMAAAWFNRWNKSFAKGKINRQVCVHAFVDDREVWQYLPWDHRGWHAGGVANNTHISVEICEPGGFTYGAGSKMVGYEVARNEGYFRRAWENTAVLCVMLCRMYGLTEKDILCHAEGYGKGIASNHGDVLHWFPKHGESMESFREAVRVGLQGVRGEVEVKKGGGNLVVDGSGGLLKEGDVVEILESAVIYYPDGPEIADWVKKSWYHKVTQVNSKGVAVLKGGKECVLLGKKVDKKSGQESAGIMTWVDRDRVNLVRSGGSESGSGSGKVIEGEQEGNSQKGELYRVQVGAFASRENAEKLVRQLKEAGFEGVIRYDS